MKVFRLLFSSFGAAAVTLLLQLVLSRRLSVADFGLYASIASVLAIGAPFAATGVNGLLLRRASVDPGALSDLKVIAARSLHWALAAAIFATTVAMSMGHADFMVALLLGTYYYAFGYQNHLTVLAQLDGDRKLVARAQVLMPFLRFAAAVSIAWVSPGLLAFSVALAVANVASAWLYWRECHARINTDRVALGANCVQEGGLRFLLKGIPYSLNGTANVAQLQLVVAMAAAYVSLEAAAVLAVANTAMAAVYIAPNAVFGLHYLPVYHKINASGQKSLVPIKHGLVAMLVGCLGALVLWGTAPVLIPLVFSEKYTVSASVLQILAYGVPFRFFSTAVGAALLTESTVRLKVIVSLVSIGIQVFYIVIFGSRSDAIGVAWSVVVSELVVAICFALIYLSCRYRVSSVGRRN